MPQIKVPKDFKVATHRYTINLGDHVQVNEGSNGFVNHMKQEIWIDTGLPSTQRNQCLLHELIHVAERYWCVRLEDNEVDRIAEGLAQILFEGFSIELDWSEHGY